jgi:hypothetical protein
VRKTLILLASTLPLLVAWRILEPIMPEGKYDWFIFYTHPKGGQSPSWYVYYTSVYLTIIIFTYIIYDLCKKIYPQLKALCLSLLILSIIRLVIYWLFRGSIAFDVLVGSFVVYSGLMYFRWRK